VAGDDGDTVQRLVGARLDIDRMHATRVNSAHARVRSNVTRREREKGSWFNELVTVCSDGQYRGFSWTLLEWKLSHQWRETRDETLALWD
jgi:hypothetical protein